MAEDIDYASILEPVAEALWGKPTAKKGKERRYGSKGARSIDLTKGTWFSFEEGVGGGTLDLIEKETGKTGRDAIDWLVKRGLVSVDQLDDRKPARKKYARELPAIPDDPPPYDTNPMDEAPPFVADHPAAATAATAPVLTTPQQLVASYDYTDAAGSLIYQVQRWEWLDNGKRKKTFTQRRPYDGEPGVWINGLSAGDYMRRGPGEDWSKFDEEKARRFNLRERTTFSGTPHGLYRIIELREAILAGEVIFLVEGEKKVEALAGLGITASCNSGGATNWSPDFAEVFRNADVVVAIDNDEPGRKRGRDVTASLYGVASRIRVLDFAAFDPSTPPKYDVADWVEAGGDAERLFALVDQVAPWEPPKFRSRFSAVPWAELDAPGPEHEWLIKGILTRAERSMMAGASQSGKSFLAIDMAMAIARGVDFFGRRVLRGGVVYQAGEGGRGVKKRLRAYRKFHGLDPAEKLPFVLLPSPVDLYASEDMTEALIAEIRHWSSTFPIPLELVVIDTLSAATPGADENSSKDVGPVLARCERIATALNTHVMIVHHMNAEGSKPRGHTSIFANLDNVITVTKIDGMHDHSNPNGRGRQIREARVTKQKDGEDGQSWRFTLPSVELGVDADGDPITSCVVAPPVASALDGVDTSEAGIKLTSQGELMLRSIYTALAKHGEVAPPDLRLPPNVRVVKWSKVKEAFTEISFEEGDEVKKADTIKKALQRWGETLYAKQIIGREAPYVWLTGRKVKGFKVPTDAEKPPRPKAAPAAPAERPANLTDDDMSAFVGAH